MTAPHLDTETDVWIQIRWQAAGHVTVGPDGKLQFPRLPIEPGLYEFQFSGSSQSVYVGESDNLRRRISHYRSPGPSQRTNIRLNDRILNHLATNSVTVATATTVTATWSGSAAEQLDLTTKAARVLAESVWILHRQRRGFSLENATQS